ncbi:entericidin A/B family lipoprotein [Litchfieldella rifensis]|uniref:Entericidin A/B family lipoprotein n=1 Tax=Litchfieldella rifensis TaxID=762643 RepID=A0ABV7LL98_9GAMM
MKKVMSLLFVLLMSASVLSGCNTLEGAGEDIEQGGEAIQDEAE